MPVDLENRLPEEGINTSNEHPLREFVWVVVSGLVGFALMLVTTALLAGWVAPKIPFKHEEELAQKFGLGQLDTSHSEQHKALQVLTDRLVKHMDLPKGMSIKTSYQASEAVNAYATLGGHIIVFGGLLEKLPNEAALAALLAHEIAHIKHRHVAASMGRGIAVSLLVTMLSTDVSGWVSQSLFGASSQLAMMSYSREYEKQADDEALRAIVSLYGHGAGYTELFNILRQEESKLPQAMRTVGLLRSHPVTQDRLDQAMGVAAKYGWSLTGTSPILPAVLRVKVRP